MSTRHRLTSDVEELLTAALGSCVRCGATRAAMASTLLCADCAEPIPEPTHLTPSGIYHAATGQHPDECTCRGCWDAAELLGAFPSAGLTWPHPPEAD